MTKYKLSNVAKEDLIRIHHYGVEKFGMVQAINILILSSSIWILLLNDLFLLNQLILLKQDTDAVYVVLIVFITK